MNLRRKPTRSDGKRTLQNLLNSALKLFALYGYHGVSTPMIAKKANVKTATFYQYFTDKDAIYKKLLSKAIFLFENNMKRVEGKLLEDRLRKFVENYLLFFAENPEYYRILHEAVYLKKRVFEKIQKILDSTVNQICQIDDPIDQMVLRWFITGPTRFIAIYNSLNSNYKVDEKVVEEIIDFTLNGIDPDNHEVMDEVFKIDVKPIALETATTRMKILQAAEKLFGSRGYKNTQVSDIAKAARVASGTVYVYFQSKEQILEELVMSTNRNLRLTLSTAIKRFEDRRDAEIAGYYTFLRFFSLHRNMYLIVRQAEFFNPEISRNYYRKIFESYLPPLEKAISAGQFRKISPQTLALIFMGIGHFMGEDLVVKNYASNVDVKEHLLRLSLYIYKGLAVKEKETSSLKK
ncbi:TetR/AcrR family transcriptional regulator [Pseudothermotoga thermarum]|uniref:Transcriptional regulator, TetR family n=1 Tax=Pseudothermotoga thermarum DSM 5069 TaxID=688269 RepID=F7YUB7_9THEM|nr:TetR/AcrR family transcriptional regulator [Pseudothermotoga thermarum]AEH51316.1 transcriptional regulator, TetR family [Pseudothermotoga thermarum DSM 5069]